MLPADVNSFTAMTEYCVGLDIAKPTVSWIQRGRLLSPSGLRAAPKSASGNSSAVYSAEARQTRGPGCSGRTNWSGGAGGTGGQLPNLKFVRDSDPFLTAADVTALGRMSEAVTAPRLICAEPTLFAGSVIAA
jgi:hypothetical protein